VDLPARSFDLARHGVAPPQFLERVSGFNVKRSTIQFKLVVIMPMLSLKIEMAAFWTHCISRFRVAACLAGSQS